MLGIVFICNKKKRVAKFCFMPKKPMLMTSSSSLRILIDRETKLVIAALWPQNANSSQSHEHSKTKFWLPKILLHNTNWSLKLCNRTRFTVVRNKKVLMTWNFNSSFQSCKSEFIALFTGLYDQLIELVHHMYNQTLPGSHSVPQNLPLIHKQRYGANNWSFWLQPCPHVKLSYNLSPWETSGPSHLTFPHRTHACNHLFRLNYLYLPPHFYIL